MKETHTTIITLVSLVGIVVLVGVVSFFITQKQSEDPLQDPLTDLTAEREGNFTDLDGLPFSFEEYEGTVRVVNSWATWCPFCVNELPDFNTLAEEYRDQNVIVIAVNRKEGADHAKSFLRRLAPTDAILFVQDAEDIFYKSIGGFSMPETLFYDTQGNVVFHKRGFMTLSEMQKHVESALMRNSK